MSRVPALAPRQRISAQAGDGEISSRGVAEPRPMLPSIGTLILAAWCVVGVWFSTERLLSPTVGWRPAVSADTRGIVGLPLDESASVSAIRETIGLFGAADGPWLVVYPPDIDEVSLEYVRSQLLHTEYPREVEVITTAGRPRLPLSAYAGTITHPRIRFGGDDAVAVEHRGFTAYVRSAR